MPWTYQQSTGILRHDGAIVASNGYSGRGAGKNNPSMQTIANVGPIPQGTWNIGPLHTSLHTGPAQ